jgi:hypothetical protein
VRELTVHARDWFEAQSIGKAAEVLWKRGYSFDYISDRQLSLAHANNGRIEVPGGLYSVVAIPRTEHMPLETLRRLLRLAETGATIIFEEQLPADVPGWSKLEARRAEHKKLLQDVRFSTSTDATNLYQECRLGAGRLLVGNLEAALGAAAVRREALFDRPGLMCVRRTVNGGSWYFVANRSEQDPIEGWVPLSVTAGSVMILDPASGRTGLARCGSPQRATDSAPVAPGSPAAQPTHVGCEVYLQLEPGESVLLHCTNAEESQASSWSYWQVGGESAEVTNAWSLRFVEGGPELPAGARLKRLVSWTELADTNASRFAGTGRYTVEFDSPSGQGGYYGVDLGKVCQSARVWLNGENLGTLLAPPFHFICTLKPTHNVLEVEVTNVSANRIRDLDRCGVKWKNFYDINFVGLDYKAFDASNWPLTQSGLLGPVLLTPVKERRFEN